MGTSARERLTTKERLHQIESSVQARSERLRKRLLTILQIALASGLSFWICQKYLHHPAPMFAPISSVIIIGYSGGDRVRRSFDMALGCIIGVFVGDMLFFAIGTGVWQITVAVAVSMAVASLISKSQLVSNQVAIGSILIATIMPPGGATTDVDRTMDAIVGSAIGLVVVALMPSSPLGEVRNEVSRALAIVSSVLHDVADGLRTNDAPLIWTALTEVRGSQNTINSMLAAAKQGREFTRISPFFWSSRRYVKSMERILLPVDNIVRNTRVLARRSYVLVTDHDTVSDAQIDIIDELSEIALELSEMYVADSDINEAVQIPAIVRRLRAIGARSDMSLLESDSVLSAYAILAQTRSVTSDLLEVCGMSRASAIASLAPTSDTPAVEPEILDDEK